MKKLTEKITSKEDMPEVYLSKVFRNLLGDVICPPWWLKREWGRIEGGIYPTTTEIVLQFNKVVPQFALHIAAEDPTQIAYTPDAAYGMADRQVRTSLARFAVKYYPQLSDDSIRDLQAEHLAELNTSFEQLTGQALIEVYKSGAVSTCMSKRDIEYSGHKNPTEVYDAPNISMAVLRDKSGAITARCMLYTPTPTDLRYIRCYGDPKLQSKLRRCGYKAGTWHGAEFKTILTKDENVYLMPYLDGNGSSGSMDSSCVALIDNKITSITRETYRKLMEINSRCVSYCTIPSGIVRLENISSEKFTATCCLTGRSLNLLTEQFHSFWVDGEVKVICHEALDLHTMKKCQVTCGGKEAYVMGAVGTFMYHSTLYLDLPEIREYFGWTHLSLKYYPNEQDWMQPRDNTYCQLPDKSYIKIEDSIFVAVMDNSSPAWRFYHESEIEKGFVKLHSMQRGRLYYATSGVTVLKTVTGRKVVKGLYPVHECIDGTVDFERNLNGVLILGKRVWWPKGDPRPDISTSSEIYRNALRKRLEADGTYELNARLLVDDFISHYIEIDGEYLYSYEGLISWAKLWAHPTVKAHDLGKAINEIMKERSTCAVA